MNARLSRTKLARKVAEDLLAGRKVVIDEIAAYLVTTKRQREADLIVRSTLEELEREGHVVATVTTASKTEDDIRQTVQKLVGASKVELDERIDPSILGGIQITTPSRILDASVRRRINALRERKI